MSGGGVGGSSGGGASGPGPAPELAWLPVECCAVHAAYQRSVEGKGSQRLIARIAAEFSWVKFGALIAVREDGGGAAPAADEAYEPGRFLIIDGQHRMLAAARRGDIAALPAVVHRSLGLAQQALAFVGANRDRVAMSAAALLRARLVAGEPAALRIKAICDAAGIAILPYPVGAKRAPVGATAAVPALNALVRDFAAPGIAEFAVKAVALCWGGDKGGLRGEFFHAAARFLQRGSGGPDALAAALRRAGLRRVSAVVDETAGGFNARVTAVYALVYGAGAGAAAVGSAREPAIRNTEREAAVDPAPKPDDAAATGIPAAARTSAGSASEAQSRQGALAYSATNADPTARNRAEPAEMAGAAGGSPATQLPRGPKRYAAAARWPLDHWTGRALELPAGTPMLFQDDPIAARDHGSPGAVGRPATFVAGMSSAAVA